MSVHNLSDMRRDAEVQIAISEMLRWKALPARERLKKAVELANFVAGKKFNQSDPFLFAKTFNNLMEDATCPYDLGFPLTRTNIKPTRKAAE